jgi:hypothetical protein
MTLIKLGRRVINLDAVTEILLEPPGSVGPGHPACVAFIGGHTIELVGTEADQLRDRFARPTPAAPGRIEVAEAVPVTASPGLMEAHQHVADTLEADLT